MGMTRAPGEPSTKHGAHNSSFSVAVYGGGSPGHGFRKGSFGRSRTWVPDQKNTNRHRQRDRLPQRDRPSLPPARQNGLVANNNNNFTEYKQIGRTLMAVSPEQRPGQLDRMQAQSLPNSSTNNKLPQGNYRQTNSAPHRPQQKKPEVPPRLPKLNSLVKNHKVEPPQSYRNGHTAGKTTRDGGVKNLRSHRFATSWADARAGRITADSSSPTREESPRFRAVQSWGPASTSVSPNASRMNGKSPSIRSPDKNPTKSPSLSSVRGSQTKHVNQRKVVQGKPKVDSKTAKPLRRQTTTHAEKQNAGGLKRNKTMYMEKGAEQLNVDDQEKLQKTVYGASPVSRIYNSKTTLSRGDLHSRAQTSSSLTEKSPKPYLHHQTVRSTPPWRRGEYILTKNETKTYKSIKGVYDNKRYKTERQEHVLAKISDAEGDEMRRSNENAKDAMLRKIQSKIQHQIQLQRIREKFEEDQAKRFRTQYVTIRQLKHETEDRQAYGLSEDLNKPEDHRVKLKRKRPPLKTYEVYSEDDIREKNRRKYENIFDVKTGPLLVDPNPKPPKMAGIDTIELDDHVDDGASGRRTDAKDKKVPKRTEVKDVLADARRVLDQQKGNDDSPRSPRKAKGKPTTTAPSRGKTSNNTSGAPLKAAVSSMDPKKEEMQKIDDDLDSLDLDDDDDDDDDDIFEKARRKYNINLDSDDDD